MRLSLLPVSPVVDLQPGEDGAAGDQGARQDAEPSQVGGEQLPDGVLKHGELDTAVQSGSYLSGPDEADSQLGRRLLTPAWQVILRLTSRIST